MILFRLSLIITLFFLGTTTTNAQNYSKNIDFNFIPADDYQDCAAIFFNGNMLVDSYSPQGKCALDGKTNGKITVAAIELKGDRGTSLWDLSFQVVIKNEKTGTMWLYSKHSLREVMLDDILKECKPGDNIIIVTEDKRYALPHNEIDLKTGC